MGAIDISRQSIQETYFKIELLNKYDNVLDELEGIVTSGNISIDANSDIRRVCNLELVLNNKNLIPSDNSSKIWFDKKFRLNVGIKNFSTDKIEWFNKGIYYFSNPNISLDQGTSNISIEGLDKICTFTNDFNGNLGYITKIDANVPVFEAVKNLLSLVGETNYIINDVENLTIPYDLKKDSTSSVLDFLIEIRDLYMGYEFFYNEEGTFIWQKIRDRKNDNVEYIFDEDDKSIISYTNTPDFNNVKNKIIVYGGQFEDKEQITSTIENIKDNKFGSYYIGERILTIIDDTIQTQEQANLRAEYELYLCSNFNENVNIDAIQILSLDVNKVITINKKDCGVEGNHLIKRLNYQLGNDGTMSVETTKLYY